MCLLWKTLENARSNYKFVINIEDGMQAVHLDYEKSTGQTTK